jgi:hypothetical protein
MRPVASLRVKTLITSPAEKTRVPVGRPVPIRGVAWAGDTGPVVGVDVSVDGGRRWRTATLYPRQRTRHGWRQWERLWTPSEAGHYTVLARARDAANDVQPLEQEWNPSGYGWNVVPRLHVAAGDGDWPLPDAPPEPRGASPPPPAALERACGGCHDGDVIGQQRLSRAQWERELNKMLGWGAKVSEEERGPLLDFLSRRYGYVEKLR